MPLEDIRLVYGDSNGKLDIQKASGEGHRLIDVYIDPSHLSRGDYMEVKVGTKGIMRIPLKTTNYSLVQKFTGGYNGISVFGFIRALLGEEVYVEADEDEDILIRVYDKDGNAKDISGYSVAVYKVIETGIDKSRLLCSGSEDFLIMPRVYQETSVTGDDASIDKTVSLTNVSQMDGLPLIKDGYVVPAGIKFVLKTLIADGYFSSAGTTSYDKNILHLKKDTFEVFSPLKMYGIHLEDSVGKTSTPKQNIAGIDLSRRVWLDCEDFTFEEGVEIGITAEIKGSGTGTGITTKIYTDVILVMLKTKM